MQSSTYGKFSRLCSTSPFIDGKLPKEEYQHEVPREYEEESDISRENMNSCKPCDDLGWKIDGASDTDLERNTIESKIASPNIPDVNTKQQLTRHCVQNMTNIGPWCDVMPFPITGSVPPPPRRLLLPRCPLVRLGPPGPAAGATWDPTRCSLSWGSQSTTTASSCRWSRQCWPSVQHCCPHLDR